MRRIDIRLSTDRVLRPHNLKLPSSQSGLGGPVPPQCLLPALIYRSVPSIRLTRQIYVPGAQPCLLEAQLRTNELPGNLNSWYEPNMDGVLALPPPPCDLYDNGARVS